MNVLIERLHLVRRRAVLAAGLLSAAWLPADAAPAINTLKGGLFGGRDGFAILGHDPVAYFTLGKAVRGSDEHVLEWMGAKWKFASRTHLDMFRAEPANYAPQYGGYCAYGVARGYLVKIDPEQFRIVDGKLYRRRGPGRVAEGPGRLHPDRGHQVPGPARQVNRRTT